MLKLDPNGYVLNLFDAALSWDVRAANMIPDGGSGIKIGPDWKMARTGGLGSNFRPLGPEF